MTIIQKSIKKLYSQFFIVCLRALDYFHYFSIQNDIIIYRCIPIFPAMLQIMTNMNFPFVSNSSNEPLYNIIVA